MIEFWSEFLRTDEEFNSFQMIKEFPNRWWNKRTLNRLIQKIDNTGTSYRKPRESARTARTTANIARVSELIYSQDTQDDDPGIQANLKFSAKHASTEAP